MTDKESSRSRYTPPSPRKAPPSPRWYVVLTLGCFAVGVVVIIANYLSGNSANNVFLIGGLALILVGFLLSMRLR